MQYLLLEWSHSWNEEKCRELDSALNVEVRLRQRLQKLLEGQLEEAVVLLLVHLQSVGDPSSATSLHSSHL